MIEGENADGVLPPELNPRLLLRIPKYGGSVEIHVFLVELRPGHYEYVLRNYMILERRYSGTFTIPLAAAPMLARELRKSRTPPQRRAR